MSDNGMGGRRVGKKSYDFSGNLSFTKTGNYEEDTDYSASQGYGRLTTWQQLILDYNNQNKFIRAQKRKWLPPKKRK